MGGFMPIQVRIANLTPLETVQYDVTVYYRASNTAQYDNLRLNRTKATWSGAIPIQTQMEGGLDYFITARANGDTSGRLATLKSGKNTAPHRVRISSP